MTVKLVGSTSGSVSLQAPASTSGGAHRVLTLPDINSTVDTTGRAGNILQVKNHSFTPGTVSGTGTTFHSVSSGNVQITPSAASSKFFLMLTGVNGHVNMEGSTGNHGCRYYFGMSINGGSFVSVTTGNAFNASDEEPLAATHIQGALGNYFDFPIDYSFVVSPSYTLGQTIDFRPYFTKNYAMGNSLTYYYQHNTQSSSGDHRNTFTIMEIAV